LVKFKGHFSILQGKVFVRFDRRESYTPKLESGCTIRGVCGFGVRCITAIVHIGLETKSNRNSSSDAQRDLPAGVMSLALGHCTSMQLLK